MAEKNRYFNLTVAGSAVVSVGPGTLVRVVVNKAVVNGVVTLYDGANLGATTKIGTITFGAALKEDPPISTTFDCQFSNGLVITSTVAADITVVTNGVDAPVPLQFPSLATWFDFTDTSTLFTDAGVNRVQADGNAIYQANDKTGRGNNLIQATLGNRPLYKVGLQNGLSAARLDGSDDNLTKASPTGIPDANSPLSLIVVGTNTTTQGPDTYFTTNKWFAAMGNAGGGSTHARFTTTGILDYDVAAVWTQNTPIIVSSILDAGVDVSVFRNGGAAVGTALGTTFATGAVTTMSVGAGVNVFTGDIYEVLLFSGALTSAEHNAIGRYLAAKYRIPWTLVP